MKLRVLFVMALVMILSGCSNNPNLSFFHAKQNEKEVEKLKTILENEESTSESLGVFFDSQLVVAVQVQPFSKFQKSKIEKRIEKEIKKDFPDHKVFVSSDLKIMWELKDLVEKNPSDKTLKKKLREIKALAKEET